MLKRIVPALFATVPVLFAADAITNQSLRMVSVSHTETLTLPPGGALRFADSFGELNIEGWDRPQVEITVVKRTEDYVTPENRRVTEDLDRIKVSAQVQGKDVVVMTGGPHYSLPTHHDVTIEYRIKAPMDAPMFVKHLSGEVHFQNITGNVRASVRNGGMTFDLPADSHYLVDAKSAWGAVISDFPGKSSRRFWLVGRNFKGTSDAPHQLVLKAGYGDIIIFKTRLPKYPQ
jgi:hypothetical protein